MPAVPPAAAETMAAEMREVDSVIQRRLASQVALIDQIATVPTIQVHPCTEVVGASGAEHLERLELRESGEGSVRTVEASWLFVFIGAEPRTDWLDGVLIRDDRGFLVTGPDLNRGDAPLPGWELPRDPYHLECSAPGVFAAGDVRADSVKRVASAVGEGAMAVSSAALVDRFLRTGCTPLHDAFERQTPNAEPFLPWSPCFAVPAV